MFNKPKIFQQITKILDPRDLNYIFLIGILYILNILLEVVSIASIFPLMTFIFDDNINIFGIKDYTIFFSNKLNLSPELFILIFFSIILVIKNLFSIFYTHIYIKFASDTAAKISSKIFEKRIKSYYLDFIKMGSDIFLINLKEVTVSFRSFLQNLIFFFSEAIIIFVIFIYFLVTNTLITINIAFLTLVFIIIYQLKFKNKIQEWGEARNKKSGQLNNIILLVYHSIREIKLFSKHKIFIEEYKNHTSAWYKYIRFSDFISLASRCFIEIFIATLILLFVYFSKKENYSNLNISVFLFNFIVFIRVYPSLNRILGAYLSLKNNYFTVEIISEELNKDYISSSSQIRVEINFKNNISFQNVSFKYSESEDYIIENINLKINKNEFILLKGENGSGKSTLINILCGLIKPSNGNVLLDNEKDVFNNFDSIKKIFSIVPQKPFLIKGSILNNISLSLDDKNQYLKDRTKNILDKYEIFDFIKNLKYGMETSLSENAINISGGQAQIISIARALFKKFNIIIFDEPSTALDRSNRNLFLKLLNDLKNNYTVIIITHDEIFSEITFDKIYEIKNKKVIEC